MLLSPILRQLRHLPRLFIRHATSSGPLGPALRAFLASLLLWLLAFQYCKFRYWRNPHSAFFRSEGVYDLHYSANRQAQAAAYIENANTTDDGAAGELIRGGEEPVICAAFVTVKREKMNYFAQSIGSMLEGLTEEERKALHLSILFADTNPAGHPNWKDPWLRRVVDKADTYDIPDEELARIKEAEEKRNFYVKGLFDYKYTLEYCLNSNAPYIAIFEDDIVFAEGWMARVLNALADVRHTPPARSILPDASVTRPWLYLRLFYTETALMWEQTDYWYANIHLAFALSTFTGLLTLLAIRYQFPSTRPHLDPLALAVISLVTVPAFTALVFMIGKYSLQPLSGVVKMNKYGCCTQGLVFPRTQVPGLLGYFAERVHGQTDSLIEEYANRDGLDRYALAPQVVQHVGLQSSRDNIEINARSTWAFWFEVNDQKALRREHEREVGRIRWDELRGSTEG
ncbi:uncharacterized protein BDZ99DRAFT_450552 [Mytilinidion resinicola]|uniref:Integral membrane protein n=1 Tax=Mytilinidion resinicola TaxID=574789 RepID=A0A6A6Y8A0_9PEZI|nr:uncharacterized protein BDZ99DRAFT_450552 [Mytilinidion resinicola]KAF2805042.1 hypothetical protein BDZ99DRAFT_450552 [Mytilinidion resinicola]